MSNLKKDYYGGILMLVLGLAAAWQGATYKMGTLSKMGSGFFPVSLGILLALSGAAIALTAKNSTLDGPVRAPEWRGKICITLGICAFVVLGKYGGLLPATFAIVFISALGDRKNNFKRALMLAVAMMVVCTIVFWWALKMQFPLFQWG